MRTIVKGRNIDVPDDDRQYVEQKMRRVERLLDDRSEAIVEFSREHHKSAEESRIVEVTRLPFDQIPMTPTLVAYIGTTAALGILAVVAWSYLAATVVRGVRAGEEPGAGWTEPHVASKGTPHTSAPSSIVPRNRRREAGSSPLRTRYCRIG